MPNVNVSKLNHRILTAMADDLDTTPEAIIDRMLADLRINRAGIRHDDTPEEVEARVAKLERKGADAKAARQAAKAEREAQAKAAAEASISDA